MWRNMYIILLCVILTCLKIFSQILVKLQEKGNTVHPKNIYIVLLCIILTWIKIIIQIHVIQLPIFFIVDS